MKFFIDFFQSYLRLNYLFIYSLSKKKDIYKPKYIKIENNLFFNEFYKKDKVTEHSSKSKFN